MKPLGEGGGVLGLGGGRRRREAEYDPRVVIVVALFVPFRRLDLGLDIGLGLYLCAGSCRGGAATFAPQEAQKEGEDDGRVRIITMIFMMSRVAVFVEVVVAMIWGGGHPVRLFYLRAARKADGWIVHTKNYDMGFLVLVRMRL